MKRLLFFAGVCGTAASGFAENPRPNILLILSDDAGYRDFGFQGFDPAYEQVTPRIDSIARDGARFTQAYVSANVCGPSRAGLLTGMYQQRFGFQENFPQHWEKTPDPRWTTEEWKSFGLDTSIRTMADHLRDCGYYTGVVGKWHLGYADRFAPHNRGFDFFYGMRTGSRSCFPIPALANPSGLLIPKRYEQLEKNGVFLPEEKIVHISDTLGDASIEFIGKSVEQRKPFFLFLSFTAPHTPLQPDPESLKTAQRLFPDADKSRQAYLGLMIGMDRNAGRVLDHLKERGLDQNTLVVFLNDNGGPRNNTSVNTPLRGFKYTPFEGGYRVPMALKWPGVVRPGGVVDEPVIALDLLPTFVAAAGGKLSAGLDGVDLAPLLSGRENSLGKRPFFWRDTNSEGRTQTVLRYPWKLVLRESSRWKILENPEPWLFNVEADLPETENLAESRPETVAELKALLGAWDRTLEPPRW